MESAPLSFPYIFLAAARFGYNPPLFSGEADG